MVGPWPPQGEAGMALPPRGYGPGMPETDEEQVEEEKQDQVLKREGFEEELMQEGRSEEAENIAAVETGKENL
jgi:hypothetical protein